MTLNITFLKKVIHYIFNLVLKINFKTIRLKLILITSSIVAISIFLLIYITLIIFEENIKNMLFFLHSKATTTISSEIEANINTYINKLKFDTLDQKDIEARDFQDFLLVELIQYDQLKFNRKKRFLNKPLLEKMQLTIDIKVKDLNSELNLILKEKILIKNVSSILKKPTWLLGIQINNNTLVYGVLPLSKLNKIIFKNSTESEGLYSSLLINLHGDLITDNKSQLGRKSISQLINKVFDVNSKNSVTLYKDINNKRYYCAFFKIEDLGLTLISTIPEKVALEGVNIVRQGSLFISIAIISFVILIFYFFAKTISNPIRSLAQATDSLRKGNFNSEIPIKTSDEIGQLTNDFNHMVKGLKEREKLKGALDKFVNPEIAKQAMSGDLQLGGMTKEVTVFFSDIRSFTSISEKMTPNQVVEFLNEYMTVMVSIIHKHKGVVDKFIGDAIMAIWGAPTSTGNDIENSIDAALMMRKELIDFNQERKKKNKFPIIIGCGINTGKALCGQIGSSDRLEYTVIGDTVNLASRIESLCKPFASDIVISENIYKKIKNKYECIPMDKIRVKGKSKIQYTYTILGKKNDKNKPENLTELRKLVGITWKPIKASKKKSEVKYEVV